MEIMARFPFPFPFCFATLVSLSLAGPLRPQDTNVQQLPAIVDAASGQAPAGIRLTKLNQAPAAEDFKAGALSNNQKPDLKIIPELTDIQVKPAGAATGNKDWDVTFKVN